MKCISNSFLHFSISILCASALRVDVWQYQLCTSNHMHFLNVNILVQIPYHALQTHTVSSCNNCLSNLWYQRTTVGVNIEQEYVSGTNYSGSGY